LSKIDGTFKYGVKKVNWSKGKEFTHYFTPPYISYHFNAAKLQDYIINELSNDIKIIDSNVTHDKIDADFIMDCSGKPSNYDDYEMSDYIAVNAVHVTQCFWDYPRFQYTLAIARPYGWVFGIPLQNRCSIGYMYNHNINTLEEVKEDVKHIFEEYNLTPSDTTNSFTFKNYQKKHIVEDRVVYNGNSCFFLEPLEATSIYTMDIIQRQAFDFWFNNKDKVSVNDNCVNTLKEIQNVIMMHYCNGSTFDTEFWNFAKDRGERCMINSLKDPKFNSILDRAKKDVIENYIGYGSWNAQSFKQNLDGLELYEKMEQLRS
jgi:hypothetical protein